MAKFLITYDNRSPRDYDGLYRLLASWRAVMLAESVYLVSLNSNTAEVRRIVSRTLGTDDLVAVLELKPGSDWATLNASSAANTWLSDHVQPAHKAA